MSTQRRSTGLSERYHTQDRRILTEKKTEGEKEKASTTSTLYRREAPRPPSSSPQILVLIDLPTTIPRTLHRGISNNVVGLRELLRGELDIRREQILDRALLVAVEVDRTGPGAL